MKTISQTFAITAAIATVAGLSLIPTDAHAGRGKQLFLETYNFKKPMHGYSGHAGNYYCDYQRLPQRRCDASGTSCKIVGWTLQQICQ
jgi:cobyric acid synthase